MAISRAGPDLGIQLSSLGSGSPDRLLDAASAAGFRGVGLSSMETAEWIDAGVSSRALRRKLEDRNLRADYLDPLVIWLGGVEPSFDSLKEDQVVALGAELDVPRINVTLAGPYDRSEAANAFGRLAERISAMGIIPMIEFAPFFGVSNLERAADVIRDAGIVSAGILLDAWHLARSGGKPRDIEHLPSGCIQAVHLSDASAEPQQDLIMETMTGRLFPGEGIAQVSEIIHRVQAHSPRAIFTLEVYSPLLRGADPENFARRCHEMASSAFLEAETL
jgi:sugar phosphate isomerase/epimerase